eukprot:scaffold1655_cov215-Skeletonema_marinoi.AAC.2
MASVQTCGGNVVNTIKSSAYLRVGGWYSVAGRVRRWQASVQNHWQRPGTVPRQKSWGWPLRGDGDKYTLRSGNQQPTTISTSIHLSCFIFRGRVFKSSWTYTPSSILASNHFHTVKISFQPDSLPTYSLLHRITL